MVDSSGIPRAFDVGALSRELAALRRKVDLLESRRNYVSLDRIVEGGTIGQGVGEQLTETVQEKIVVNGENLAVDALDGRVITGSTVQTDPEPEVGSKMTNGGVTVHGKAQVDTPGTGTQAETKMRAIMDSRRTKWSAGESDKWPGVWFESTPPQGSTPPQFPPGVTVGASSGLGLILQSANNGVLSPNAEVSVSPGVVGLTARPVTGGKLFGFEAGLSLNSSGFRLGSRDENGITDTSVSNEQSDRKLRIYSKNGIDIEGDLTINGEPYAPGSGGGGGDGPLEPDEDGVLRLHGTNGVDVSAGNGPLRFDGWYGVNINGPLTINGQPYTPGGTTPNPAETMRTVITGLPPGVQPVELIGTGSAVTSGFGVFTITFPPGVFPTTCMSIQAVPTTGTAGIPVVNAGRLNGIRAEMVIPSATNTNITYSYRAVGY